MIDNKTIRKVIMLNKLLPSGSPTYEDREASGAVANFTTNTVQPFVSCECQILPIQEGTGDPSPSNPRPISGTDELMLTHTTYRTAETYTFDLGQTVYGGSAEVVGGTGTITHGVVDLGDSSNNWSYVNGVFYSAPIYPVTYLATYNRILCSIYKDVYVVTSSEMNNGEIRCYSNRLYIKDSRFTDVASFVAGVTGEKVCYELATPTDFTFTGQPINSYLGANNVWTGVGNTKVTYKYKTGEGGSTKKKYLPIFYDFYGKGCRHL